MMLRKRHIQVAVLMVIWAALSGGMFRITQFAPPPPDEPPFELPFAMPPSMSTWYISQYFGNTRFAYEYRDRYYRAGQGLHFGLDFDAKCKTELIAIGDGRVVAVDDRQHGAGPHNLIIQHDDYAVVSLYGHLLERPSFYIGQPVKQGEIIALVGDPDLSCTSRPHLHLEIRDFNRGIAYNPIDFIAADWDTLALLYPPGGFQHDLRDPQRWTTPYDQPIVDMWGAMLNDYAHPWPPDWNAP